MISVIIPFYNEEKILTKNSLFFQDLSKRTELIFVDGGSSDRSVEIALNYANVLQSRKGRAAQMNYGARTAKNNILLFLHADNRVSIKTIEHIEYKIKEKGLVGGCLTQRIDSRRLVYRLIECFGNIRARITGVFYGDQGVFVERDVFLRLGSFPEVPIMEDVIFTKKLRKLGKTGVLTDNILVSARRWEKKGIIITIFLYSFINILFWLKVPLNKIKSFYDDLR